MGMPSLQRFRGGMLALLSFATHLSMASDACCDESVLLRPLATLPRETQQETWLQIEHFDPSLDWFGYGKRLGSQARTDRFQAWHLGIGRRLAPSWLLRGAYASGAQRIARIYEPRRLTTHFQTWQLAVQWQPLGHPWHIEAGFASHRLPVTGFSIYQTANTTLIAAPGTWLASNSAHDRAWFLRGVQLAEFGAWRMRVGLELRDVTVQTRYVIHDPAVRNLITRYIPQAAPWRERHASILLSMDRSLGERLSLGLDLRQLHITRAAYLPRGDGREYRDTIIADLWWGWRMNRNFSLMLRLHGNRRFLLGEIPAFYNRSVSHKFSHPFGYFSLALRYRN